jgi:hypothetical protein
VKLLSYEEHVCYTGENEKKKNHVFSKATKVSFFIFTFFLPWEAIFHATLI